MQLTQSNTVGVDLGTKLDLLISRSWRESNRWATGCARSYCRQGVEINPIPGTALPCTVRGPSLLHRKSFGGNLWRSRSPVHNLYPKYIATFISLVKMFVTRIKMESSDHCPSLEIRSIGQIILVWFLFDLWPVKNLAIKSFRRDNQAIKHTGSKILISVTNASTVSFAVDQLLKILCFNFDPSRKCYSMGHIRDFYRITWSVILQRIFGKHFITLCVCVFFFKFAPAQKTPDRNHLRSMLV